MSKYILAPSLLAADFGILGQQIEKTKKLEVPYLHIDVMDGVFVPSISFGMPVISSIRPITNQFFDVHLMIVDPERYIEEFASIGADGITFHYEATKDPKAVIDLIHKSGAKAGISLKPDTPLEEIYPYLSSVELVLVMSVEPGFGGQKFIEKSYDRIRDLRKYLDEHNLSDVIIEVDGGIGKDNVKDVLKAGATAIVSGSSVFRNKSIEDNVADFYEAFESVK